MAAKKKAGKKAGSGDSLIISKSRTKDAVRGKCNISSEFYGALDGAVRKLIATATERAMDNKRKTVKPCDL